MAEKPPAAPQGSPKPALAPINSGVPTGGSPSGSMDVVFPGRGSNIPANKSNKVA